MQRPWLPSICYDRKCDTNARVILKESQHEIISLSIHCIHYHYKWMNVDCNTKKAQTGRERETEWQAIDSISSTSISELAQIVNVWFSFFFRWIFSNYIEKNAFPSKKQQQKRMWDTHTQIDCDWLTPTRIRSIHNNIIYEWRLHSITYGDFRSICKFPCVNSK